MNAMASPDDGGCTCRFVRYRMMTAPLFVHCCHCRWCQRETGAAFALNALIEADRVHLLEGRVEVVDTPTSSGTGQKIARCPPDIHIFTSSKRPWVVLPPGTPAVAEYYRASEFWPQESLERRKALHDRGA